MQCTCGHSDKAHLSERGLCGAINGCGCNKFEYAPLTPDPSVLTRTRFAEMTENELYKWWRDTPHTQAFTALRDAILAERDALQSDLDNTVREKYRVERERDAATEEWHAFRAMFTSATEEIAQLRSQVEGARREGAREAIDHVSSVFSVSEGECRALRQFRDREYPKRGEVLCLETQCGSVKCQAHCEQRPAPANASAANLRTENHAKLYHAAHDLYFAGVWTCEGKSEARQVEMWEALRDALGLREGSATAAGVAAPAPSPESPEGSPAQGEAESVVIEVELQKSWGGAEDWWERRHVRITPALAAAIVKMGGGR